MTIIDKIILDKEWNQAMAQIDKMSLGKLNNIAFECWHGYSHALSVARETVGLLKKLGANEHMLLLGEICGLVHDLGLIGGKKDHAQRGGEAAQAFLDRLGFDSNDIGLIVHAVNNHSNGEEMNNDLDLALLVADKLDVTKDRLASTEGELSQELNKINDVSVDITDNSFVLKYEVADDFNKQAIKHWDKMATIPEKAAKHLGLDFQFMINGENVGTEFLK